MERRVNTIKVETLFSECFLDGTAFYTCRFGETVFSGFLRPGDMFQIEGVKPREWQSFSTGFFYSNMTLHVRDHEAFHRKEVKHLLERYNTFCPSRLRKLRDFTFIE